MSVPTPQIRLETPPPNFPCLGEVALCDCGTVQKFDRNNLISNHLSPRNRNKKSVMKQERLELQFLHAESHPCRFNTEIEPVTQRPASAENHPHSNARNIRRRQWQTAGHLQGRDK
jgi:hypothetical protein